MRNLEYLLQEAFIGIWRNGIMAVASVSTVALSMAVLGAFVLVVLGAHNFAERQLARFEIWADLRVGAEARQADKVKEAIRELPLCKSVEILSREKEWANFKREESADLDLGGVMGNPLPYRLSVECRDSRKVGDLAEQIRRIKGVEHVASGDDTYRYVRAVADLIKVLGLVAVLALCFTSVFLIGNAIRLTLFARRHEIRIMQLVGATNWFIRVPLVLEGVAIGAVGAAIAVALISGGSEYVVRIVQDKFPPMLRDLSSGVDVGRFVTSLVSAGAVIGALGSFISIRRFLRI